MPDYNNHRMDIKSVFEVMLREAHHVLEAFHMFDEDGILS